MVQISISNDFLYNLANSAGVVGQQPHKDITKINFVSEWTLTESLNDLKEFRFVTTSDEHTKANILMERNISVPLLTSFDGIITEKKSEKNKVTFVCKENAWHLTRRKFKCHDKPRIKYTNEEWFNKSWKFRRHISILGKKFKDISTGLDLINFPLLFHIVDTELKEHARSDGFDIVFTKTETDGTVLKLHHEIESYDFTTGELWAWIEYPEIRSGQEEEFEMYFGNSNAADQQSINGTWDDYLNGYALVQHLHKNSIDSTSKNNDGIDTSITYISGKIANAANFNAVDSKIETTSDISIDDIFAANGGGWISVWIKPNSDGEGNNSLILQKGFGVSGWDLSFTSVIGEFGKIIFNQSFNSGANNGSWETNVDIPINKNTRIDVFYDKSSILNNPTIFVNGKPRTVENTLLIETSSPSGTADSDAAETMIIGNNTGQTRTFDGTIEEVRFLKSPPTNLSELIKMEFANESAPDEYFVIKGVENYLQQADIIAEDILISANLDMPILNTTPVPGLLSLWRFDGNALDSKGTSNGTWTGNELYVRGSFNTDKSGLFDGFSYISTTDIPFGFISSDPFSFHTKLFTNATTQQIIFSKRIDDTNTNPGYILGLTNTGLPFAQISNGTTNFTVTGTKNINDGTWHTLQFSYDGSSNQSGMKIYIDGFLNITGSATAITGSITNALPLTLGAGSAGAQAFIGNLDDMRIYNQELTEKLFNRLHKMTQSDIDIIRTMMQWKLGDGHVTHINTEGLWKFDQSLTDSKNENTALLKGTEVYADGKFGTKGFSFDGTTYTTHGHTQFDLEKNDTQSYALWIKGSNTGTTEEIFSKHDGTRGFRWYFNLSDEFVIEFNDGILSHLWIYTTNLRDNNFHYISITNDNSNTAAGLKLYIDGIEANRTESGTYPTGTIKNTFVTRLGVDSSTTNYFTGVIDDFRHSYTEWTPVEVKRLYEQTDSGVSRIRDDNIPTRLIEIDFQHKDHVESLRKIAKTLGVNLYFDSRDYRVFLKQKGKTISNKFSKIMLTSPSFNLEKVSNVVNIVGNETDGVQKEKTFTNVTSLKYNYETTLANKQIATDDTLNLIGNEALTSLSNLTPDLQIKTTPDQFNKFDLTVGDKLKINEISQDLQGTFTIIKIISTSSLVTLSLSAATNSTVQTTGKDIGTIIGDIIGSIQDLNITPE